MSMYSLEKSITNLYKKYGEDILSGEGKEQVIKLLDANDTTGKAKILLSIAYELQEIKLKHEELESFKSLITFDIENIKDQDVFAYASIRLALALAEQTLIPDGKDELLKYLKGSSNKREDSVRIANAYRTCFNHLSFITEEMFGNNVIMQSVYDYETDNLYFNLLECMRPINGAVKVTVDHPISLMDWEDEAVETLANAWVYLSDNYTPSSTPVDLSEAMSKYLNPSEEEIKKWEEATGETYIRQ